MKKEYVLQAYDPWSAIAFRESWFDTFEELLVCARRWEAERKPNTSWFLQAYNDQRYDYDTDGLTEDQRDDWEEVMWGVECSRKDNEAPPPPSDLRP